MISGQKKHMNTADSPDTWTFTSLSVYKPKLHGLTDVHTWTLCYWPALVTNWCLFYTKSSGELSLHVGKGIFGSSGSLFQACSLLCSWITDLFGRTGGRARPRYTWSPWQRCSQSQGRWQVGVKAAWGSSLPGMEPSHAGS